MNRRKQTGLIALRAEMSWQGLSTVQPGFKVNRLPSKMFKHQMSPFSLT